MLIALKYLLSVSLSLSTSEYWINYICRQIYIIQSLFLFLYQPLNVRIIIYVCREDLYYLLSVSLSLLTSEY